MGKLEFATYLKKIRELRNLSINELGRLSTISPTHVLRLETCKSSVPKPETLSLLAQALNVDYRVMASIAYGDPNKIVLSQDMDIREVFATLNIYHRDKLLDDKLKQKLLSAIDLIIEK